MSTKWQNTLLLLVAGLLVAWPLLSVPVSRTGPDGEAAVIFTGSDEQAAGEIRRLAPDYQPWAVPLLEPPGDACESLLFALQAVAGGGFIGYYFGVKRERARREAPSGKASRAV